MTVMVSRDLAIYRGLNGRRVVEPWCPSTTHVETNTTYGASICGYDVRVDQEVLLNPGDFVLASTLEIFDMPLRMVGIVHDKSTLARRGLAVQNTVVEPGWSGYLTLELTNHGRDIVHLPSGAPVAQILFHAVSSITEGYRGKYQNQERGPQGPR